MSRLDRLLTRLSSTKRHDYYAGTPEHAAACAVTDERAALMDAYKGIIFDILISEGITIPESGHFKVL